MGDARLIRARARGLAGPMLVVVIGAAFLAWPGAPAVCPTRIVLHIPCPTCGMTRAARLALEGHFAGATDAHPLWFVVLPLLALGLGIEVVGYARTGKWGAAVERPPFRYATTATFAALIALWLARFLGACGGPAPI